MRSLSIAAAAAGLLAGAAALAQPAVPLNEPWSTDGALAADDAVDEAEQRYDDHVVRLPDSGRFRVSVDAADFDPMVQVIGPDGGDPVAEDDDGGEGLNARLSFAPAEAGAYTIRVLGYSEEAAGPYRLEVAALPPLPPPAIVQPSTTQNMVWRGWMGALEPTDFEIDGAHADDFAVTLRAGEEALIRLDSDAFDPVLKLYEEGAREGEPLAEDDDSGGDLDSLLVFTPERTGRYVVRVTSFEGGEGGPYRLRIGQ